MADKVIICGLRRANTLVSQMDIQQMIGRCGRSNDAFTDAEAYILVPEDDEVKAREYIHDSLPDVCSQLTEVETIAFHVLPEICNSRIANNQQMTEWFSRSFAAKCGKGIQPQEVVQYLIAQHAIRLCMGDKEKFEATPIGKVSSQYYFHPHVVWRWKEKFEEIMDGDKMEDETSLAYAFAQYGAVDYCRFDEMKDDFVSACNAFGYDLETKEVNSAFVYYSLLMNYKPVTLKYDLREARDDLSRVFSALKELAALYDWKAMKELNTAYIQARNMVPHDVAVFMENTGITNRNMAVQLLEFGITDEKGIFDGIDTIKEFGDETLIAQVEDYLHERQALRDMMREDAQQEETKQLEAEAMTEFYISHPHG